MLLPTTQFRTVTIDLYLHQGLSRSAAYLALLPQVLMRGTHKYPEMQDLERELDSLYGSDLRRNMLKKGERLLLNLRLEVANPKYLAQPEPVLAKSMELLAEVFLRPRLEQGSLVSGHVEQEKKNLAQQIASIVNEKRSYALKRCTEEMCREENFRFYQYGEPEVLEGIQAADLYDYYQRVISANPIDIYVVGDIEPAAWIDRVGELFAFPRTQDAIIPPTVVRTEPARNETVVEKQAVSQGKLVIGYRTGTTAAMDEYAPLLVYNSILGGSGTSKLFLNVREKASLAYYASSQVEVNKGLMFISAGIESQNFAQTVEIIDRQVDDLRHGVISADELHHSKRLLTQSLQKTADLPAGVIGFELQNDINGRRRRLEDLIAAIEAVTVDQVVQAGEQMRQDTTYFLASEEGSEPGHAESD